MSFGAKGIPVFSPEHQKEIDSFKDTGMSIAHRGEEYAILHTTNDAASSPYVLRSKRHVYYALVRDRMHEHLLHGIGAFGRKSTLPGWFSDKDGKLRSVK